jgi:hypothetical protein
LLFTLRAPLFWYAHSAVVVDPIDLRFVEGAEQLLVEAAGRVEVPAERLLDDDARPPRGVVRVLHQHRRSQLLRDDAEELRRRGQVEEHVGRALLRRGDALVQLGVDGGIVEPNNRKSTDQEVSACKRFPAASDVDRAQIFP